MLTITKEFLLTHPNMVLVYDMCDNGNALYEYSDIQGLLNSYGFVTIPVPNRCSTAFYSVPEYEVVFYKEVHKLIDNIKMNPELTYLIPKLGSNPRYASNLWSYIVHPKIKRLLSDYKNIIYLWDEQEENDKKLTNAWFVYVDLTGEPIIEQVFNYKEYDKKSKDITKSKKYLTIIGLMHGKSIDSIRIKLKSENLISKEIMRNI